MKKGILTRDKGRVGKVALALAALVFALLVATPMRANA